MGRASFGGQQDISGYLADLYARYEDRLTSLANRAADRADSEQQALDNDAIDRWQQGEMTDAEFLAYANQRLAESADSPEEQTYWNKVLRDANKSILSEQISDTAESIINDINAGRKTYTDLLNYYKQQQSKLRPSDPLYDELKSQIEQVNDQIAENAISGALSKVDYQFRAGRLTGSQAGAQMRALAERYRVNDPAKYYQLLSNALEYEQYAGTYTAGGGGGRGGGGGSDTTSINGTIDALQGLEDRLGSLSEQFEAGERVGTITYEDQNGKLVTEDVSLMNPDGTPTRGMKSADDEMLNVLDELEAAYIEKGDRSAAGDVSNRRAQFITDHIQPRNTISVENQANALLDNLQSTIEAAANSSDPVLAWRKVQAAADRVSSWHRRVNKKSTATFVGKVDDKAARDNPELNAANRRESLTSADARDRTTQEFASRADALLAYAQTVARAKDVSGLEGAGDILVGMGFSETQAEAMIQRTSAAVDLVTGIPLGNYARVFIPGEGLVFTPVAETTQTTTGPDGGLVTRPVRVPVGVDGNPIADESRGQKLEQIMAEVNGRMEPIYGVSEQVYLIGGQEVSQSEYEQFNKRVQTLQGKEKQTAEDEQELAMLQAAGAPRAFRQVLAPRADGKDGAVTWLQTEDGMWHKNRVNAKGSGGVPFIFSGKDARGAQQLANQINPATGQAYDPTGRAFFNERDYQQKKSHNVIEGTGDDWYDVAERGKAEQRRLTDRNALAESLKQGPGQTPFGIGNGMFGGGKAGQIIAKSAQQLGINLGAPSTNREQYAGIKSRGLQAGIDGRNTVAPVRASIKPPAVNLAPIRPPGRGFGATVDTAGIRNRLAGILGKRRGSLSRTGTSTRETYAGSGFSGFQK